MNELTYKISMIGPTRVGKTSVVASMLDMTKDELLQGTPLTFKPKNLETEKKIALHARELKSSIRAGEFNSGAVSGTQAPFTFKLALQAVNEEQHILDFEILDFPGGWIDPVCRPTNAEAEWKTCQDWIHDSSVLIIPVESTVLMEANTPKEKGAIEYNLHVEEIKQIIAEWAKHRNEKLSNADTAIDKAAYAVSTIMFTPVKCESYFNDNVNKQQKDRSDKLYTAVQQEYKEVIEAAKGNLTHQDARLEVLYIPIDTIGVVNIVRGNWTPDGDILRFSAKYHITGDKVHPKGADDIFIALCKTIIHAQQQIELYRLKTLSAESKDALKSAQEKQDHAEKDEGFWGNLKLWWTDERERRRQTASEHAKAASDAEEKRNQQQGKVNTVAKVIAEIAKRDVSPRMKAITY